MSKRRSRTSWVHRVNGWGDRFAKCPHIADLIRRGEKNQNVIMLARGDSHPDVLARLLPTECYQNESQDFLFDNMQIFPAFVLGEKSEVSYARARRSERDSVLVTHALASVLPEVHTDRAFFTDLLNTVLSNRRVRLAQRNQTNLLRDLNIDRVFSWPSRVQEVFIERLLLLVHFDYRDLCRELDLKRFSCAVSLSEGRNVYNRAIGFAVFGGPGTAIVIDSFVLRSEPYTFVETKDLRKLEIHEDEAIWKFQFEPGSHPTSEILVRRAIFPHRLIGIAILRRQHKDWRVLRYVPNPVFESVQNLEKNIHIPDQYNRIGRMLEGYPEYKKRLRLIYSERPEGTIAYNGNDTREFLGSQTEE